MQQWVLVGTSRRGHQERLAAAKDVFERWHTSNVTGPAKKTVKNLGASLQRDMRGCLSGAVRKVLLEHLAELHSTFQPIGNLAALCEELVASVPQLLENICRAIMELWKKATKTLHKELVAKLKPPTRAGNHPNICLLYPVRGFAREIVRTDPTSEDDLIAKQEVEQGLVQILREANQLPTIREKALPKLEAGAHSGQSLTIRLPAGLLAFHLSFPFLDVLEVMLLRKVHLLSRASMIAPTFGREPPFPPLHHVSAFHNEKVCLLVQ